MLDSFTGKRILAKKSSKFQFLTPQVQISSFIAFLCDNFFRFWPINFYKKFLFRPNRRWSAISTITMALAITALLYEKKYSRNITSPDDDNQEDIEMNSMDSEESYLSDNQNALSDEIAEPITRPPKSKDKELDETIAKKDKKENNIETASEVHIALANIALNS